VLSSDLVRNDKCPKGLTGGGPCSCLGSDL